MYAHIYGDLDDLLRKEHQEQMEIAEMWLLGFLIGLQFEFPLMSPDLLKDTPIH